MSLNRKLSVSSGVEGESDVPGMKRALLEIIAAGVASTRADVERYANCTYLKTCLVAKRSLDPSVAIQSAIQFLIDNEFIRVKNEIKEGDQEGVVCLQILIANLFT